ncbi:Mur ligase family protein [Campylobacter concisus]|uniref:Bifunctional folypolyglutamate synthetase / dihydrofolate synthetase n=1 Tax=Campylobacter concisus TaxID=199 RepID=A0A0M4TMI0_9BACT|nr:Mur ligase family protein [Campylobacter concisus]ALF47414.1 bifunctional folypolyglutamate synthetase / dihydrofolate synthetase [Campylobacter concisus]
MSLAKFLDGKPLYYKEIDYGRIIRAYATIKEHIKPFKIIHIIGTNGKGSTGRFLAQILSQNGAKVGHYTSPHIFKFNERFWLNGEVASDEILEAAHERLQALLSDEYKIKTSYFEYMTLLSAVLFEDCDYFVCEAGMGGVLDATNVFEKELSIFTPIGFDHTAILGNSLEEISRTKFEAMGKRAILNDEMNEISVTIAKEIASERGAILSFPREILTKENLNEIANYADKFNLPEFLRSNLTLAYAAAKILDSGIDIKKLGALTLRGRCEKITSNLYADVGHNELGAKAIAKKFSSKEFSDKKLTLVYNSFLDKDFKAVLAALKPVIDSVLLYHYRCEGRELGGELINKALNELEISHREFEPSDMNDIKEAKNGKIYLAFGSFHLAEAFLKEYYASKGL